MASALLRTGFAARPLSAIFVQRATFTASAGRLSGKEDELHTDKDARAAHVDKKKAQSMKSHWEEDLASNSESIIKSERRETQSVEQELKDLQQEAKQAAEASKQK